MRKLRIILTMSIIAIVSAASAQAEIYKGKFLLEPWIVNDFIQKKEEHKLLVKEVTTQYTVLDSLNFALKLSMDIRDDLTTLDNKKNQRISLLEQELKLTDDLYQSSLSLNVKGEAAIVELQINLKQEKIKSKMARFWSKFFGITTGVGLVTGAILIKQYVL